jgi:aromatase
VEYLEQSATDERIQIWATANGEAKTWTSRRELDEAAMRIEFRQERSTPPVGAMGGTWIVEEASDRECRVLLLHDYRAVDDDPANLEWIAKAVDRNSNSELGALKANAELATSRGDLLLSFEDTVSLEGSAEAAYDFVNEANLWEQRLPHVARVSLEEDVPGLQMLEMDTRTKDGSVHTTKSVRVTFPHERIVYKQIQVPALMRLHTGLWTFSANDATATSQHTVVINEDNIAAVLGPEAGVADARTFVHQALSANSMATLGLARDFAKARR